MAKRFAHRLFSKIPYQAVSMVDPRQVSYNRGGNASDKRSWQNLMQAQSLPGTAVPKACGSGEHPSISLAESWGFRTPVKLDRKKHHTCVYHVYKVDLG
jgi:hypothetical protein